MIVRSIKGGRAKVARLASQKQTNNNMKKKMIFTLVGENTHARYYESSCPITQFPRKYFNLEKELNYLRSTLLNKSLCPDKNNVRIIAISDAHTHIERLVFLGCKVDDGRYGTLVGVHLDGKQTSLSEGGDSNAVYPDEVYLRRIASANGMLLEVKK